MHNLCIIKKETVHILSTNTAEIVDKSVGKLLQDHKRPGITLL